MTRVLVIDDDLGTRETFEAILRLAGFDVGTAAKNENWRWLLCSSRFNDGHTTFNTLNDHRR